MSEAWRVRLGRAAGGRGGAVRLAAVIAAGGVVGVAWRLLTPVAEQWASGYEKGLAADVTLAGLELLAGTVVALLGLRRGGRGATLRLLVAVAASCVASLVAWGVGRVLGVRTLDLVGVVLLWPLAVAAVTLAATLVITLVSPGRD